MSTASVTASSQVMETSRTTFRLNEGTLTISDARRSKGSRKLRVVSFTPRISSFDTTNTSSGANEFRGFFTLFWISMFLFTVQTYISSFEKHGYALSMAFATMFSRHAISLALTDAILVGSTAFCVLFAKALSTGLIKYYWAGVVIQHCFQTMVLACAITWTFNQRWPWVQSGFLTLHSLVMLMKMHSYMSVNGCLQHLNAQSQHLLDRLRAETEAHGGWNACLSSAIARQAELDAATSADPTPLDTPSELPDGTKRPLSNIPTADTLRKRLVAAAAAAAVRAGTAHTEGPQTHVLPGREKHDAATPMTLVDHPDEHISALAKEYAELESELTSSGPQRVRWPENVTFRSFAIYQLIPTLVYELEYPRTDRIRPLYLFEKTVATFGTFALLYTVTESFIIPLTPTPNQSFFRSLLDLALPFMIAYLLLFFIIFECICNGFAELSYFADRQFYEDWVSNRSPQFARPVVLTDPRSSWNSTSWDEFARKWNKPVHVFLLHHVYASTMASYKLSRTSAMLVTFLLSALAHELVMVVVTRKIRMYLFLLQLIQIPLIMVSRFPTIKRNKLLGNVIFWLGLYAGFPLLCVAYVAY